MDIKNIQKIILGNDIQKITKNKPFNEIVHILNFITLTKNYKALHSILPVLKDKNELLFYRQLNYFSPIENTILNKDIQSFDLLTKYIKDINIIKLIELLYYSIDNNFEYSLNFFINTIFNINPNYIIYYYSQENKDNIFHKMLNRNISFIYYFFEIAKDKITNFLHLLNYKNKNTLTPIHLLLLKYQSKDIIEILHLFDKFDTNNIIEWNNIIYDFENYLLYSKSIDKNIFDFFINKINQNILHYRPIDKNSDFYNKKIKNNKQLTVPIINYDYKLLDGPKINKKIKIITNKLKNEYTHYLGDIPDELIGYNYIISKYNNFISPFNKIILNNLFKYLNENNYKYYTNNSSFINTKVFEKISENLNYINININYFHTPNTDLLIISKDIFNHIKNTINKHDNITLFFPISLIYYNINNLTIYNKNDTIINNLYDKENYSHYNLLVYNINNGKITSYIYDPIGPINLKFNTHILYKLIKKLNNELGNINTINQVDIFMPLGIQKLEHYFTKKNNLIVRCDPAGYCMAWCIYMIDVFLSSNYKNFYEFVNIYIYNTKGYNLNSIIRNYTIKINNHLYKILNKKIFMEYLTTTDYKKIFKKLY